MLFRSEDFSDLLAIAFVPTHTSALAKETSLSHKKKLTVNRKKHISKDETLTLIATYQVLSKMQATQTKRPNLRFVVGLVLGVAAHILATNFDRRFLSPNLNPVNTW